MEISIMDYLEVATARDNPIAFSILSKIKRELLKIVEIDDHPRKAGSIYFKRPIKTILVSNLWENFISSRSRLTLVEKAEDISTFLNIGPVTVCKYGKEGPIKEIQVEARKAFSKVNDKRLKITEKWQNLSNLHPNKSALEIADLIGEIVELNSLTIASYGSESSDKGVKKQAHIALKLSIARNHDLINEWKDMKYVHRIEDSKRIAKELSNKTNLSIFTVLHSVLECDDAQIKKDIRKILPFFLSKKHQFDEKLKNLENEPLSPLQKIEKVAKRENLKVSSVISTVKFSSNKDHKKLAQKAYHENIEKRYNITKNWLNAKNLFPNHSPLQIVNQLIKIIPIKFSGILYTARYSKNKVVSNEASTILSNYYDENYGITEIWLELLQNSKEKDDLEVLNEVSQKIQKPKRTILFYAVKSPNMKINQLARKLEKKVSEREYEITERYIKYCIENLNASDIWIFSSIANDLNIKNTTAASLGTYSPDKRVRSVAYRTIRLLRGIVDKRIPATEKYPKLNLYDVCDLYYTNKLSLEEVASLIGCTVRVIATYMGNQGLSRRSLSKSLELRWKNPAKRKKLEEVEWFKKVNENKRKKFRETNPDFTPENIRNMYFEEEMSQEEIGKHFNMSQSIIAYYMKQYGIKCRTSSENSRLFYKNKEKRKKYDKSMVGENQKIIINLLKTSNGMFISQLLEQPVLRNKSRNSIDGCLSNMVKKNFLTREYRQNANRPTKKQYYFYQITDKGESITQ